MHELRYFLDCDYTMTDHPMYGIKDSWNYNRYVPMPRYGGEECQGLLESTDQDYVEWYYDLLISEFSSYTNAILDYAVN